MTTAVYLRISEDRLGEGLGVERQREDARALAERRGWTVREFVDNDISATNGKLRPGYAALMAAVKSGEVERIVVFHTSRLWRNRRERADGIELLREARVSVVPVKGPELDMTTAYGRGMAGMIGEFDTMEVEVKSERQRREAQQRAEQGRPAGGRRAFGYTADGMALVEAEAAALRDAYQRLLGGRSLSGIAQDLNAAGFITTAGGPWRHNAVRLMMGNLRNAGIRTHRGREVTQGLWPAIVSEAAVRAAIAMLSEPKRRTNHVGSARRWLGTRLYRCGRTDCGALVVSTYREKYADGRVRRVYRCPSCGLSRLADPADKWVRRLVADRLGREDLADLLVSGPDEAALADLRAQSMALRERRTSAVKLWARQVLDDDELEMAKREIAEELAAIEAKLVEAGRENALAPLLASEDPVADWKKLEGRIDEEQAVVRALTTVWLLPPPPGRREFDSSTVHPDWKPANPVR
ncbi:recombinase family protein [Dactylosporangium sp. AC04546]|uniref:recombinase family protein n=1 Tax=Dactylosporangium sp. AC04546 TaxID=2862460 RepID=UPI001EE06285|nr:recombinase family protein [Dactylosporangium sp. AC04546]WVK82325.1 recombinase family protein [Dactylosporangium sp. AC04546]